MVASFAFNKTKTVESKLSIAKPQRHRLPVFTMWSITLLIATSVAIVNYFIRSMGAFLLDWKSTIMQQFMTSLQERFSAAALGALGLAAFSALLATFASLLVVWVAPQSAGSGLPEIKGYLNGNATPPIFKGICFPVSVVGIIFSTAAGFPIGREGPMVAIGGHVGFTIARILGFRYTQHTVTVDKDDDHHLANFFDAERLQNAKRIGCTLGGASGIATAFNAPIGSILYMFEEATATSWSNEHTLRVFICSLVSVLLSRGLLNLQGEDVHRLLIFDATQGMNFASSGVAWTWQDLPFFTALAAVLGFISAFFSRILLRTWSYRAARRQHRSKSSQILECLAYAVLCSLVFAFVPLLVGCTEAPDQHTRLLSASGVVSVQHTCEENSHNEVATLLLNNAEEAVKHLFSRSAGRLSLLSMAIALISYTGLVVGMPGLPVPMGFFVPSMLIGALVGRCMGELLGSIGFAFALSHPGVYAQVGSASMLAGYTHMTLAIVVLLVEASHDLSLVAPLMLGACISYLVSSCINSHGYDEQLILRKGVPFLEAELPEEMDSSHVTALNLIQHLPIEALLSHEMPLLQVELALECYPGADFPIVDGQKRCVGLTSRLHLEAAINAYKEFQAEFARGCSEVPGTSRSLPSIVSVSATGDHMISVDHIMDPAPYTVLQDMTAPRIYHLFLKAGLNSACVIQRNGEVVGILSRTSLILAQAHAHMHNSEPTTWDAEAGTPSDDILSQNSIMQKSKSNISNSSLGLPRLSANALATLEGTTLSI